MLLEKLESLATIQSKNPRRLFFSLCSLPHNTRNTTSSTAATFFVCEKNGFLGRPPNKKKRREQRGHFVLWEKHDWMCDTELDDKELAHFLQAHLHKMDTCYVDKWQSSAACLSSHTPLNIVFAP